VVICCGNHPFTGADERMTMPDVGIVKSH
jgi:hypothetical protein